MGSVKPTRIAELSAVIAAGVDVLDKHHTANGLPSLSFDPSAPFKVDYPPKVEDARQQVLEATDELQSLTAGPMITWMKPHHNTHVPYQAIYRFKIATSFPPGKEEATYAELAAAAGLSESDVKRIVRAAMTYRIFREVRPGVVGHTAASKLFAVTPELQQWVGMTTEELWPTSTKLCDAIEKYPGSNEPNEAAFNLAHNTSLPAFQFFSDKPSRAARFADAMALFDHGSGYEPEHLLDHYPWTALGRATVVDVGGSVGHIAISIARRFPDITCIVQDRPEVLAAAVIPNDLEKRLRFEPHDFFNEQPVKDADVYYLRWILHDWADKYAAKILRALVPAMKPGAKVILSEYLIPEPGEIPMSLEREKRAFDLAMWELQNSKERSVEDWRDLFAMADPRFKLTKVVKPPNANLGILEATWEE